MPLACNLDDLIIHRVRTRQKARAEFARQLRVGMNLLRSHVATECCSMFCYQTHGEMSYLDVLNCIPTSTVYESSGMECVARDASVWLKEQDRIDCLVHP